MLSDTSSPIGAGMPQLFVGLCLIVAGAVTTLLGLRCWDIARCCYFFFNHCLQQYSFKRITVTEEARGDGTEVE